MRFIRPDYSVHSVSKGTPTPVGRNTERGIQFLNLGLSPSAVEGKCVSLCSPELSRQTGQPSAGFVSRLAG